MRAGGRELLIHARNAKPIRSRPPVSRVPAREGFGMGIPIMKTLADTFSIEGGASTGTEVRMRFLL